MLDMNFSDIANIGSAFAFMILTFALIYKALPIYRENGQKQAEAWRENAYGNLQLAKAVEGFKIQQNNNIGQCETFQRLQKDCLAKMEDRLSSKIDEVKGINIATLRSAEEINAWHKAKGQKKEDYGL